MIMDGIRSLLLCDVVIFTQYLVHIIILLCLVWALSGVIVAHFVCLSDCGVCVCVWMNEQKQVSISTVILCIIEWCE